MSVHVHVGVKPNFIGSVTPDTLRKKDLLSSSGGSVTSSIPSPSHSARSLLTSSLPTKLMVMINSSPPPSSQSSGLDETTQSELTQVPSSNTQPASSDQDTSEQIQVTEQTPSVENSLEEVSSKEPPIVESHTEQTVSEPVPIDVKDSLSSPKAKVADFSNKKPQQNQQLSFLDRYSQLAVQEEEKTSELVSRKKKSSKGKKKKKKKDSDGKVKPMRSQSIEKASDESAKENQAPSLSDLIDETPAVTRTSDIVTPSSIAGDCIIEDNQSNEDTHPIAVQQDKDNTEVGINLIDNSHDIQQAVTSLEESINNDTVTSSSNPFGDDDDVDTNHITKESIPAQSSRKLSNEYQFGNMESTDTEFYTLLDRAASSVRTKRQSPQTSPQRKPQPSEPAIVTQEETEELPQLVQEQTEDSTTATDKHSLLGMSSRDLYSQ